MRAAVLAVGWLAACGGASSDPGTGAILHVAGAQFVPEGPPAPSGGPEVMAVALLHSTVAPGVRGEPLEGTVGQGATGIVFALADDAGAWVVPAELPDVLDPEHPSFHVAFDLANDAPLGDAHLIVQAVDRDGRAGEAWAAPVAIAAAAPVEGALVVHLTWAGDADLDLHVVDANAVEIWAGNPSALDPPQPGAPPRDPAEVAAAGAYRGDSNGGCVVDGRSSEDVVWPEDAPRGPYVVRVDARSLCGETSAPWRVEVYWQGALLASAAGTATAADTRLAHGTGAGTKALEYAIE